MTDVATGAARRATPDAALASGASGPRRTTFILVLLFAGCDLMPPAVGVLVDGRTSRASLSTALLGTTISPSALTALLQTASWLVFIALALVLVVRELGTVGAGRAYGDAVGLALVAGVLLLAQFSTWLSAGAYTPSRPVLVLLLAAVAIWLARPGAADFRVFGHITAWLAFASVLFGLVSPDAWIDPSAWNGETKALIGHELLAGFLGHENTLGIILAAGFPFVVDAYKGRLRSFFIGVTLVAVVLTASRTSMAAVGVVLLAMIMTSVVGSRTARPLLVTGGVLMLVGGVILPAIVEDSAFTERGVVWRLAENSWDGAQAFGQGPYAFSRETVLSSDLVRTMHYVIFHGHSTYISCRTEIGYVGVVLMGLLLLRTLVKAAGLFATVRSPLYAILGLLMLGILETPLRLDTVNDQAWVCWGIVLLLACLPVTERTVRTRTRTEKRA